MDIYKITNKVCNFIAITTFLLGKQSSPASAANFSRKNTTNEISLVDKTKAKNSQQSTMNEAKNEDAFNYFEEALGQKEEKEASFYQKKTKNKKVPEKHLIFASTKKSPNLGLNTMKKIVKDSEIKSNLALTFKLNKEKSTFYESIPVSLLVLMIIKAKHNQVELLENPNELTHLFSDPNLKIFYNLLNIFKQISENDTHNGIKLANFLVLKDSNNKLINLRAGENQSTESFILKEVLLNNKIQEKKKIKKIVFRLAFFLSLLLVAYLIIKKNREIQNLNEVLSIQKALETVQDIEKNSFETEVFILKNALVEIVSKFSTLTEVLINDKNVQLPDNIRELVLTHNKDLKIVFKEIQKALIKLLLGKK